MALPLLACIAAVCRRAPAPAPVLLDPRAPALNQRAPDVFRARFETSKGAFVVEVRREWAPRGADRFYNLVAHGFFDGARFFRVRRGSFVQFGVPGDPAVAQAWRHATIPDDPRVAANRRGSIAYAFTAANTRATQVFISLADHPEFDAEGFAPFGTVVSGMEVVDSLYAGYGEAAGGGMRAGRQDSLFAAGNAWLARGFPLLDHIVRATVEGAPGRDPHR
ncbi:MAG TPA: peptidylprolyl isomerase [Longimicrobiaceae bacterium]